MKATPLVGLAVALGIGLHACGAGVVSPGQGGDASATDDGLGSGGVTGAGFEYVAIIDVERDETSFSCGATNGPGSDIDAVALIRGGATIGYGLTGSAHFDENASGECTNQSCSGGNCKYASLSTTFSLTDLLSRTEGPPDAVVKSSSGGDDTGYMSLNAGTLQIQIGDTKGRSLAQAFRSGDQIKVFEVDQSKKTDANGCVCTPEHYQVFIQDKNGDNIQLKPVLFDPSNAGTCGATPGSDDLRGCGTTVFAVP